MENKLIQRIVAVASVLLLTACIDSQNDDVSAADDSAVQQKNQNQQVLPKQPEAVETDATNVKGIRLRLLDNNGACQIDTGKQLLYLKPMAPCHFVRIAGSLQLYQKGSTTVIATVGTPVKQARCGQEVQGILIENGEIAISGEIGQGSIFCADKGLDGFHFSLF